LFTRNDIRRVHLIGIGGTAMAALAAMLQEQGLQVTGSDQGIYPPMSDFLARRGIPVRESYDARNIEDGVDLVVVGNAVSRGNPEVEAVLDRGMRYRSLPEMLRDWFIEEKRTLVVTGTHGKTTTASLLSWILYSAGRDPGFLIGGIPANFSEGFRWGRGEDVVLEGDEYDTAFFDKRPKFLHYLPRIVVLGAVEYDHADIYEDLSALLKSFRLLLRLIPRSGSLIVNSTDANAMGLAAEAPCPVVTCALEDPAAAWSACDIHTREGRTRFGVIHQGMDVSSCSWPLAGRHNVQNALLALAAAHAAGIQVEAALPALSTFRGVRRRLEYLGDYGGIQLYDDFAHHPTAIRATLVALRELYPAGRIWAVLEPRSNTMCRNVFQTALPEALVPADRVVVGAVHRAERIPPAERLDAQGVVEGLRRDGCSAWHIQKVHEIAAFLAGHAGPGDIVCLMSNGGFGGLADKLRTALAARGASA
jgi:UDP-N-acetylmuramate: L-alanyl-gamma-D-glutamyl-meso-diaminopimelate ligase